MTRETDEILRKIHRDRRGRWWWKGAGRREVFPAPGFADRLCIVDPDTVNIWKEYPPPLTGERGEYVFEREIVLSDLDPRAHGEPGRWGRSQYPRRGPMVHGLIHSTTEV